MEAATKRGSRFEEEIARLLRAVGFRVIINSSAARPRQTDLYAISDDLHILVETKNRKRPVDVGDIDALRARLGRVTPDVVGAIFTTSKLTGGAIRAIEADRTREVLAFTKEEIERVRAGRLNLRTLIERKRGALRVDGQAWFGSSVRNQYLKVTLPRGSIQFCFEPVAKPYFATGGTLNDATYALQIPDPGWGVAGEGALLRLQLALRDAQDLQDILGYLHDHFGLSENGAFSIHQSDTSWHGIGAAPFVKAVTDWRKRYMHSRLTNVHHSEEIRYFDQFRAGWVLVSAQQRVNWKTAGGISESFLHRSELAIQLPGVPVNAAAFVDVCRYTGNEWAQFEYVGERLTSMRRLKRAITLEVLGTVVGTSPWDTERRQSERLVVGVIARNPFFRKKSLLAELTSDERLALRGLSEVELLLCSLSDWHDDGDIIDHYTLEGFETTYAASANVIRPFGTWNRILKRTDRRQPATELDKLLRHTKRLTRGL